MGVKLGEEVGYTIRFEDQTTNPVNLTLEKSWICGFCGESLYSFFFRLMKTTTKLKIIVSPNQRIVCDFDWELSDLEDFTKELIDSKTLVEDKKDEFKNSILIQEVPIKLRGMQWEQLYQMEAAFIPEVNGELDTQNFEKFEETGTPGQSSSKSGPWRKVLSWEPIRYHQLILLKEFNLVDEIWKESRPQPPNKPTRVHDIIRTWFSLVLDC
ncbi:hypothetical protein FCM35_KLT10138 [Carex littledalei]|uniref:AGC-kinase C-terminal domain-containing protein n=1 Tax=Carex littledalei TaxID=544730 RepID=A0A833W2T6_9POAL|nr:hypothetical protein FCM35_KLT10138 [Carex littledalei]